MKVSEHVSFIGSQNPCLRVFDIIMTTDYGTSYNSYLVQGKETVIVDCVHEDFSENFIEQISQITDIKNIRYFIANHTEPDHSGSLQKLLSLNPNIEVLGSTSAIRNLKQITNQEFTKRIVQTGDQLDLGDGVVLDFIISPNLHWPDTMFTYLKADKVLFTCDFFGSHFCEPMVFDSLVKNKEIHIQETQKYYDAIFGPFPSYVRAGLDRVRDLDVETIATSHGPVLQNSIQRIFSLYEEWSKEKDPDEEIPIFYVSAYGYTKKMAESFVEVFKGLDIPAKSYDMLEHPMEEMAEILNRSKAVLFGSPTINRDALKPIWDLISCTDVININHKPALVFGSYGWSGEACELLGKRLKDIHYRVHPTSIRAIFNPNEEEYQKIKVAAEEFAQQIQ
ncbi:flavo-diiron protein FprA2 [Clostridia bacterium]|nr:flavo-diiron protein FprA2 [Clostridia bacterium]